jgi:hypothetical protein
MYPDTGKKPSNPEAMQFVSLFQRQMPVQYGMSLNTSDA